MNCACGSGQSFQRCCWPFIRGIERPATAEQLMRSRYTAYTKANIGYIGQTCHGSAKAQFDPIRAKQWAKRNRWLGLTIVATERGGPNDTLGFVEFIAYYADNTGKQSLHEQSEFHKIDGVWYYVAGSHQ